MSILATAALLIMALESMDSVLVTVPSGAVDVLVVQEASAQAARMMMVFMSLDFTGVLGRVRCVIRVRLHQERCEAEGALMTSQNPQRPGAQE